MSGWHVVLTRHTWAATRFILSYLFERAVITDTHVEGRNSQQTNAAFIPPWLMFTLKGAWSVVTYYWAKSHRSCRLSRWCSDIVKRRWFWFIYRFSWPQEKYRTTAALLVKINRLLHLTPMTAWDQFECLHTSFVTVNSELLRPARWVTRQSSFCCLPPGTWQKGNHCR